MSLPRWTVSAAILASWGCSGADAGGSGGAGAGGSGPESVWHEGDTALTVEAEGYWQGTWRFDATAAELTAEQQTMLASMSFTAPAACMADALEYRVTLAGAGGTRELFTSEGGVGEQSCKLDAIIDPAAFADFVETLGCVSCNGNAEAEAPADGATYTVTAGSGCTHGLAGRKVLSLVVPVDGEYRFVTSDCGAPTLTLREVASGDVLATTSGEPGAGCAELQHALTGATEVELETEGAGSLRIERLAP